MKKINSATILIVSCFVFNFVCHKDWTQDFTPVEREIMNSLQNRNHEKFAEYLNENVDFYTYTWSARFLKSRDLKKYLQKESIFYDYLFDFKKAEPEVDLSHSERYLSFQEMISKCAVNFSCGSNEYMGEYGPNVRELVFVHRYPDGVGTSNTIFIRCKNKSDCKIFKINIQ